MIPLVDLAADDGSDVVACQRRSLQVQARRANERLCEHASTFRITPKDQV